MAKQIEISEMSNTWGVIWRHPGDAKEHYGFRDLPSSAGLWLGIVSGNAVTRILEAELGEIIATKPGAYGGQCRTVLVDVEKLEAACRRYWDRQNEREATTDRSNCHYCGMRATGINFFGVPACPECS